jgi:pilus assembly protein FimV
MFETTSAYNKIALSAAAGVLLWLAAAAAQAAGLGAIQVKSGLGQSFVAEIEITGLQGDDLLTAQARMASVEEFQAAKLPYVTLVRQIRVGIETRASKSFVTLVSTAPANEPAINLMVEFSWRGGRIVQKYPILLDPSK